MKQAIRNALAERRFFLTVFRFFFVKLPKLIKKKLERFCIKVDTAIALPYLRLISKCTKIDPQTVVFISSRGAYDCNPKAICEELIRRKLPYKIYWVARHSKQPEDLAFPPEVTPVFRDSYEFHKACAAARVIVDNSVSLAYMLYKKKPGQVLIETWHGAIGIKKFSKDTNKDKVWVRKAEKEGAQTDYCISNSAFETQLYRETFWPQAEILEYGHARNDILFAEENAGLAALKKKIFDFYDIPAGKKLCLYAPTFRSDFDINTYRLPYRSLINALTQRFGGEWVILTRFHQLVRKKIKNVSFPAEVINVSDYPDIQELMRFTDVGITDYSSWICEYMETGRPGFLFATDLDQFIENERELFFPLSSYPFPLARNSEELFENILRFDEEQFAAECNSFLQRYGCVDDGHACARAADKICELMQTV